MKQKNKTKVLSITLPAMMAALGIAVMLLGGIFGVMTYAAPLIASAFLIPVIVELGDRSAWLCYAATAVMGMVILPDKELACFYLFVGFYPIVRPLFYRIRAGVLRAAAKLLFFAVCIAVDYTCLWFVFRLEAVMADLKEAGAVMNAVFFAALILTMLLFDTALRAAEMVYMRRIRPKLMGVK